MYRLLRNILFLLPAETAHYFSMNVFKAACSVSFIRKMLQNTFSADGDSLAKNEFGLSFKNPVGLGAGHALRPGTPRRGLGDRRRIDRVGDARQRAEP